MGRMSSSDKIFAPQKQANDIEGTLHFGKEKGAEKVSVPHFMCLCMRSYCPSCVEKNIRFRSIESVGPECK